MPTLWLLDIEAHQQRYTMEWRDHLPVLLAQAAEERGQGGWTIQVVSGDVGEQVPTPGAFLNFAATNVYKSSQVTTMARAFERGEVKPGDKILVTDAWHPGIIQLRYMSDLLRIPVEIHGMWHAGSYDPHDFLGRLITDKRWSTAFESALFHAIDVNHFATQFHIDLFKQTFGAVDDGRICLTGWPMDVGGGLNPHLFGGLSEKVGFGDDRARQGLTSGGAEPRPESGPGGRGFVCWIGRLGCFARG